MEVENRQPSEQLAQNLQSQLSAIRTKISRLTDAYLDGGFDLAEFQERKNKLMSERKDIEEKIAVLERKGNRWLELARKWVLGANQAQIMAFGNNFQEMRAFLEEIGSNRKIQNQTLAVELKEPWIYLHGLTKQCPAKGRARDEKEFSLRMWT
jgi:hypothetical protein